MALVRVMPPLINVVYHFSRAPGSQGKQTGIGEGTALGTSIVGFTVHRKIGEKNGGTVFGGRGQYWGFFTVVISYIILTNGLGSEVVM